MNVLKNSSVVNMDPEYIDRRTGPIDITEIMLKTALNTIQSINLWKSGWGKEGESEHISKLRVTKRLIIISAKLWQREVSTLSHTMTPFDAPQKNKPFENTVGKGEIARNEQFLLFPQRFLPVWIIFFHFR